MVTVTQASTGFCNEIEAKLSKVIWILNMTKLLKHCYDAKPLTIIILCTVMVYIIYRL